MIIRAFRENDYERAQALLETVQTYHATERPDIYRNVKDFMPGSYYGTSLNRPEALSAVAEIDGTVAGICLVSLEETPPGHPLLMPRKYGFIEVLCVHAAFRRQGVAEGLMNYVKARAEVLDLCGLDLGVTAFNGPAKALYEKLGFAARNCKMEWKTKKEM